MLAICQVAHPGSYESLVVMMEAAGYDCAYPGEHLRDLLKKIGCDTVVSLEGVAEGWRQDLRVRKLEATVEDMDRADLYLDVKAHRNGVHVAKKWPRLKNRTLWYRINGAEPTNVPGKGDELDPPCPVLTPNLWYKAPSFVADSVLERSYACWPPFLRLNDFNLPRVTAAFRDPVCLVHNLRGWCYGEVGDRLIPKGLKCYGQGSPAGLTPYWDHPLLLAGALAMVHLKSSDAPGYALYEALSAGCPVVCPRRLIQRCKMEELFRDGETCLVFDGFEPSAIDPDGCAAEVEAALERLRDPAENKRIGEAGRKRLRELVWSTGKDALGLKDFLGRVFP